MIGNNESSEFKDNNENKDNENDEDLDLNNPLPESLLDEDPERLDSNENEELSYKDSKISKNIKWHKTEDIEFVSSDSENKDKPDDLTDINSSNNNVNDNSPLNIDYDKVNKEMPLFTKLKSIIREDLKRKRPLIAISGLVLSILLILISISLIAGNSDRVVDNVAFGEVGFLAAFIMLIAILILIVSALKLFSSKILDGAFSFMKDVEKFEQYDDNDTNNSSTDNDNTVKSDDIHSESSKKDNESKSQR